MQHQHAVGIHVQVGIVDVCMQLLVTRKHNGAPRVPQQLRFGGGRLDDRAVRAQIAVQHRQRAAADQRFFDRKNDLVVVDLGAHYVLAQGLAIDRDGIGMQQVGPLLVQPREQCAQATGIVKIFHQVGTGRAQIGNQRRAECQLVKTLQRQVHTGAARHRHQVHQRVGGAAYGKYRDHGVVKRLRRQHPGRAQVFPHHVDDAPSGGGRHLGMARIGRGN